MAEINLDSGFFNAVMVDNVPDRVYDADDVNSYFDGLISKDGIFATVSTACQVVASSGMNVVVKAGKGKVGNHWFYIRSDTSIEVSISDVVLNRIDAVVVKLDLTNRTISLYVKNGTLSSSPVAPTLTRTDEVYEIALAYISVNKNITSITSTMITDTRSNNDLCGWIVGLIEQFDTTTLFNQYETAQNDFLSNKTEEFNNWFETNKETIKATSLYREYSSIYRTTQNNEVSFTIPTSINYVNGLDVLNVYINGFKIAQDQYSISSDGATLTLTSPLYVIGTEIEFVNKKCVEGTVAESTVTRLEELETKVNALTNIDYKCTGSDDNVSISNIVKAFLNGTGDYSGVEDNANLYIRVVGNLGISSIIDSTYIFDLNSETASNRKVYLDFCNATIPNIALNATTLAIFSAIDNVEISNANIKLQVENSNVTRYGFHGGSIKDCKLTALLNNSNITMYGAWACDVIKDCEIIITCDSESTNTIYGAYSCRKVITNTINITKGISILASGKQLLMGNFVNQNLSISSEVADIATILI